MTYSKNLTIVILMLVAIVMILPYCTTETTDTSKKPEKPKPKVVTTAETGSSYPSSVNQSCVLTPSEFNSWFSGGTVTLNGLVNPANSLETFDSNCDFYKWSWQMFLWHFSPKDGSYVYDSAPFFDLEGQDLVVDGTQNAVRGGKLERDGQAGLVSGVLMSQEKPGLTPNGSLVYYAIHVNDVYAYMVSGQNSTPKQLNLNTFPTTQSQLDLITDYAKNVYDVTIEDGQSLAMELKSSWIKLPSGTDASRYITIVADVPSYTQVSDQEWTWDGTTYETGVTLAMVGYHVVGSAAGHPEMIWATFEHIDNVPNVDYYYKDEHGATQEMKTFENNGTPKRKNWVFMNGDSTKMASNQMYMELKGSNIVAEPTLNISPSSTTRSNPWGNAPSADNAVNNTEIIALNMNIEGLLLGADVRRNYFLVGATWASNGVVANAGDQLQIVAGSKLLANSTMETYFQYKNCFNCHQGGNISGLSHIFDEINPLPIPSGSN